MRNNYIMTVNNRITDDGGHHVHDSGPLTVRNGIEDLFDFLGMLDGHDYWMTALQ